MDNRQGKILIVENDDLMRDFLVELLSPHHEVDVANNIEEALDKFVIASWDIALIDQDLAEETGDVLIDKIRHHNLPVITVLMVGGEIPTTAPELLKCDLSLRKPFLNPDQVLIALSWALKIHRARFMTVLS